MTATALAQKKNEVILITKSLVNKLIVLVLVFLPRFHALLNAGFVKMPYTHNTLGINWCYYPSVVFI